MLDSVAPQATTFPEDPTYFRGVLGVLRTGGLGSMRELRVKFCFNEPGTLPNYEVCNGKGRYAHIFGRTHTSYAAREEDPSIPEEVFRPETVDTVSYSMTELQQMLAERLERSPRHAPRTIARDPMQDVQALLYA